MSPKGKVIMREGDPILIGETIRMEHIESHKEALTTFFEAEWKKHDGDKLRQGALPHALVRTGVAYLNEIYGPDGTLEILDAIRSMLKRSKS